MSSEVILEFTSEGIELIRAPYPFNFVTLLNDMAKDGIETQNAGSLLCG
jgi:hypothetical protein